MDYIGGPPCDPPEYMHLHVCPLSDDYEPTCLCGDLQKDHNGGVWFCDTFLCKCSEFVLEEQKCICDEY